MAILSRILKFRVVAIPFLVLTSGILFFNSNLSPYIVSKFDETFYSITVNKLFKNHVYLIYYVIST